MQYLSCCYPSSKSSSIKINRIYRLHTGNTYRNTGYNQLLNYDAWFFVKTLREKVAASNEN